MNLYLPHFRGEPHQTLDVRFPRPMRGRFRKLLKKTGWGRDLTAQLYRMYRKLPKKPKQQRRHKQLRERENDRGERI